MAEHICGAVLPNTVGPYVEHLAACPKTHPDHAAFCQAIVSMIAWDAAMAERSATVRERSDVTGERSRNVSERSPEGDERSCERCGTVFVTANVRKRFCSTACRSGGHRERSATVRERSGRSA